MENTAIAKKHQNQMFWESIAKKHEERMNLLKSREIQRSLMRKIRLAKIQKRDEEKDRVDPYL